MYVPASAPDFLFTRGRELYVAAAYAITTVISLDVLMAVKLKLKWGYETPI